MKRYDHLIIGFGKGGKTLAYTLAKKGYKVGLIEKSKKMYGGTCINIGCIPSKFIEKESRFCAKLEDKEYGYNNAIKKKKEFISLLNSKNYEKIASVADVIDGKAEFLDDNNIKVIYEDGSVENIYSDYIHINTGAREFIPPIKGINESKYVFTSTKLLDHEKLPQNLVIIGAGYIGLEFASYYANFGSKITILQNDNLFLPREDEEIREKILEVLNSRGIEIIFNANITEIKDVENNAVVTYNDKNISADLVLVATGRIPNTKGLGLENTSVQLTARGAVVVDKYNKTTAKNIWSMGDVNGGLQFTYISLDDFRIVKDNILGESLRTTENRGAIPYSVFIEPPFSRVGLTEKEALEQGYDIKVARLEAGAIPKSMIMGKKMGLLKVIINSKDDTILGAHLFVEESHELINIFKLAIDQKIPYTVLRDNIYTHPTIAEGINDLLANI